MVQPSDERQTRYFRRRRNRARRQAYAVGAPPVPKPQKVEGVPVELALLRQVHQHLSPDQHASPRDGSLRLGATTVTTTTGCRSQACIAPFLLSRKPLLLGCRFRGVHAQHRRRHRRGRLRVCTRKFGNHLLQVHFGAGPERCRAVHELVGTKRLPPWIQQRAQTLYLQRGLPHTFVFPHLQQYFPHVLHLQGILGVQYIWTQSSGLQ